MVADNRAREPSGVEKQVFTLWPTPGSVDARPGDLMPQWALALREPRPWRLAPAEMATGAAVLLAIGGAVTSDGPWRGLATPLLQTSGDHALAARLIGTADFDRQSCGRKCPPVGLQGIRRSVRSWANRSKKASSVGW